MLRITVHDNPEFLTFQVEGMLADTLVQELECCWKATHPADPDRAVQIDLTGVTYLDDSGKKLLAALHAQGAEFVAAGCLMKAIVAEITGKPECINPVSNFKERALYREKLSGRVRAIQRSFMYANSGTSTDHETLLDNFTAQLTEAAYLVALQHDGDDSWIDLKLDLWEVLADAIHKHRRELSRGSAGSKTVDARAEVSRCNEYGSVITEQ